MINFLDSKVLNFDIINTESEITLLCDIGRLHIDKVKKETSYIWSYPPPEKLNRKLMTILGRFSRNKIGKFTGSIRANQCFRVAVDYNISTIEVDNLPDFDDSIYTDYIQYRKLVGYGFSNFNSFKASKHVMDTAPKINKQEIKMPNSNLVNLVTKAKQCINDNTSVFVDMSGKRKLVDNIYISSSVLDKDEIVTVSYDGGFCVFTDENDLKKNLIIVVNWWK